MVVRAKFRVTGKSEFDGNGFEVKLSAVTTGSDENKSFFKWTPSAEIRLSTLNVEAAEQYVVGAEYYVDFTRAEASK